MLCVILSLYGGKIFSRRVVLTRVGLIESLTQLLKGIEMLIKELIKRLQCFGEEHNVNIEVDAECGHLKIKCEIDDVQFKYGDCILTGYTD